MARSHSCQQGLRQARCIAVGNYDQPLACGQRQAFHQIQQHGQLPRITYCAVFFRLVATAKAQPVHRHHTLTLRLQASGQVAIKPLRCGAGG